MEVIYLETGRPFLQDMGKWVPPESEGEAWKCREQQALHCRWQGQQWPGAKRASLPMWAGRVVERSCPRETSSHQTTEAFSPADEIGNVPIHMKHYSLQSKKQACLLLVHKRTKPGDQSTQQPKRNWFFAKINRKSIIFLKDKFWTCRGRKFYRKINAYKSMYYSYNVRWKRLFK